MSTQEEKLHKLEAMIDIVDKDAVSVEELSQMVVIFVETVKAFKEKAESMTQDTAERMRADFQDALTDLKVISENTLNSLRGESNAKVDQLKNLVAVALNKIETFVAIVPKNGENGKPGKNGSPDTPYEVRDKLESLKNNERIDVSAIKGLDESNSKLKDDILDRAIAILDQRSSVNVQSLSQVKEDLAHKIWGINTQRLTVSSTQPINPQLNDLWYDTA